MSDKIIAMVLVVLCAMLLLQGCASVSEKIENAGQVETTISKTSNQKGEPIWTVESKSDALVTAKTEEMDLTVDNRGKPSVWETILGLMFSRTDINIGDSDAD